jgi:protein-tyrosine phosphatase
LVGVVLGVSTPKPTAIDGTSPRVLGARADCRAVTTCTVEWELARSPVRVFAGVSPSDIDRSRPIAVVEDALEVTLPVPTPGRTTYFEIVPRRAKHGPIVTDRFLRLASAPNTRDLGGYGTYDGKHVRWGRVFQSDGLERLSDADRTRLTTLGLRTTCPAATSSPSATASTSSEPSGPSDSSAPVDPSAPTDPPAPSALVDAVIREAAAAVTSRGARERDGALLRSLARGDLPQWVECTLLDSRVGWGAALILTTLGVPRETIVADFLQSTVLGDPPPPERITLDAQFEAVRKRYKTFGRYLGKGLGLNQRTYLKLRKRLLV